MVTGACGFLGSEIVRRAVAEGWHVCAFDRERGRLPAEVEFFEGDVGDPKAMTKAFANVTALIHAAGLAHVFGPGAKDTVRFDAINEMGTANVMEAARRSGVSHIVVVSSVSVYGNYRGDSCDEKIPCQPRSPYAISKWKGELRALECAAKGGFAATILRFATIYGEGDRGNVAKLISALHRGRFVWPGSGLNRKSLIHKEDAARACLRVLECSVSLNPIYNVSAPPVSMREIVSAISEALRRPIPRISLPMALFRVVGAIARAIGDTDQFEQRLQKFIHDDVYDSSRFESMFDYATKVTLIDGIRREVESLITR
jgi:nucleoside-diphosphate-sugar epimerase